MQTVKLITIAACLTCGLFNTAHAYTRLTCGGNNLGIESAITFEMDRVAIPAESEREADLLASINNWNSLRGMNDMLSAIGGDSVAGITHGNNKNEVWVGTGTSSSEEPAPMTSHCTSG